MNKPSDSPNNGTHQPRQKASPDEPARLREIVGEEPDPDALRRLLTPAEGTAVPSCAWSRVRGATSGAAGLLLFFSGG